MSTRRRTTDPDRALGVEIITRLLTDRDRTPYPDQQPVEVAALGILQALTHQGWRRTTARSARSWQDTTTGAPADPESARRHAARARAFLTAPEPRQEDDGA